MIINTNLEGVIRLIPDGRETEGVIVMRDGSIIEIWERNRRCHSYPLAKADTLWTRRPGPTKEQAL